MFAFIKKLIKKTPADGAVHRECPPDRASSPKADPQPAHSPAPSRAREGRGLELPLKPIMESLPLELQTCIVEPEVSEVCIHVPLEKVLAQLSKGCVRISFGELRQLAAGVFAADPSRDHMPVTLPLGEIISRLNPALIERRRTQRHVSVPEDISSPFDKDGNGLVFAAGPSASSPEPAAVPNRISQPVPAADAPAAPKPSGLGSTGRISLTSASTPAAPSVTPPPAPVLPEQRPISFGNGRMQQPPEKPIKPVGPASPPIRMAAPVSAPESVQPLRDQMPPVAPSAAVPGSAKAPVEAPILAGLTSLAESWPDQIRREIVESRLVDAKLALPFGPIGQALKAGRIIFTWKEVRSWITGQAASAGSPHDALTVELPLKVVAPLYLARQQARKPQEKVKIDEDIPNLFFGFPQPEPAGTKIAAMTARPEDTNFYVWDDATESARVDESDAKKPPTPGTRFLSKYATPNEVVSRAASLDGVAGALIALPDGLMVASRLASDLNGDTLAAFLPQIFGKVSQCTKELRMGDLNNLNFTVGNVPWKIFRVNSIFFAAFGRSGEPLPTARLAALAAELDHKPRN